MTVDTQLSALFGGLDTRPGFNERLLDRLQEEIALEARRTQEALRLEQLRHRVARQELHPWKQALGRWITLETAGIAALVALTVTTLCPADQLKQAAPLILTGVGLLIASAPVLGPLLLRNRAKAL